MERLTKKSVGNFKYDLKDHEHIIGEFATYDAFFNYSMAVKRLGEYEDTGLTPEEFTDLQSCLEDEAGTGGAGAIGLISDLIELMKYRKLEAEGRLIKLPCKVGDTVYDIYEFVENRDSPEIYEYKTKEITVGKDKQGDYFIIDSTIFRVGDFEKTVFLTREDAEKAIASYD